MPALMAAQVVDDMLQKDHLFDIALPRIPARCACLHQIPSHKTSHKVVRNEAPGTHHIVRYSACCLDKPAD